MPDFEITFEYKDNILTVNYNDGSAKEIYKLDGTPEKLLETIKQVMQDESTTVEILTMGDEQEPCANCGRTITKGEKYILCDGCCKSFCFDCDKNGIVKSHKCFE